MLEWSGMVDNVALLYLYLDFQYISFQLLPHKGITDAFLWYMSVCLCKCILIM